MFDDFRHKRAKRLHFLYGFYMAGVPISRRMYKELFNLSYNTTYKDLRVFKGIYPDCRVTP